jgi:hypothetical protein
MTSEIQDAKIKIFTTIKIIGVMLDNFLQFLTDTKQLLFFATFANPSQHNSNACKNPEYLHDSDFNVVCMRSTFHFWGQD